jgi:hypothetical protein
VSAYSVAIDQTTKTIDSRARHFRNLVVTVVSVGLGSIGWAAVTWTFSPLAGLLLLFPACGLFFFLDAKLLNDWRSHLLDAWVEKDIDFGAFCDAISAITTLPKGTLQSMLATLPSAGDFVEEQRISSSTREAAAALTNTVHAGESDLMALKAAAFAVATGSLILAVILWMWQPILGITLLALFPFMQNSLRRWRLRVLGERTVAARAKPDFSNAKYDELVANLPGHPIAPAARPVLVSNSSVGQSNPHVLT